MAATKKSGTHSSRLLRSTVVYRGHIFDIHRDRVREPGGILTTREVVIHRGSVVLIPRLADGRILLVRQYRHAARRSLWELPAGRIERGELPLRAAQRELEEETGFRARDLRRLFDFFPSPGFLSEHMVVFLAESFRPGYSQPDDDERLAVRAFRLAELERRIHSGTIRDGKTIAALLFFSRFLAHHSRPASRR